MLSVQTGGNDSVGESHEQRISLSLKRTLSVYIVLHKTRVGYGTALLV
jgi:hypothetical protein